MNFIFHERQEGFLCAQHCLNALLQGSYFTAVDLGDIANQLDRDERNHLSEAGLTSEGYLNHIARGSENMDDSGFFSVQVISKALEVWGLELIVLPRNNAMDPVMLSDKQAFICHFKQHWFTIRKLGFQWFNLNSLFNKPELVSDTYLCLYLTQLQQEGYTIFQVNGQLPQSEADELFKVNPVIQASSAQNRRNYSHENQQIQDDNDDDEDDEMLKQALAASLNEERDQEPSLQKVILDSANLEFEADLASAIQMSLETAPDNSEAPEIPSNPIQEPTSNIREDVIRKRQKFLDNLNQNKD